MTMASFLTSLSLSFSAYKMGTAITQSHGSVVGMNPSNAC